MSSENPGEIWMRVSEDHEQRVGRAVRAWLELARASQEFVFRVETRTKP